MAYIGKQPIVGNFQVCDAISVVNGQAAYTMQVASTNVNPESANHMLVSLNGVLQKPGSSFTISGSTITFASNLVTNDVIDFIILLGDVLNIGTPSDDAVKTASLQANAVTGAKLNTDVISAQTALASAPADTDELLISDAGVLKRIDYSLLKSTPGLTFLATATGSDASAISLDGYFSSSYDHYVIFYSVYGATDNTDTVVRVRQSDSDVTSSNYRYAGQGRYITSSASSANDAGGWDAAYWRIASSDNTNNILYQTTGQMILSNPLSTSTYKTFTTTSIGYNSGSPPNAIRVWNYAGYFKANTSALSGISFLYDGGNINGTIKLFGVQNS